MEQDPKRGQGEEKRRRAPKSDMPRIEQIRRKKREKRLRAAAVLVLVLAAILAYLGGLLAPSINFFSNLLDSARIALSPGEGWPQKIEPDSLADAYSLFSMPVYEQKAQSADMCCSLHIIGQLVDLKQLVQTVVFYII